jgi:hypothetical protein
MGRTRQRPKQQYIAKSEQATKDPNLILKSLDTFNFQQLDHLSKLIPAYKEAKIQKSLYSTDEEEIMKANMYMQEQSKLSQASNMKSVLFLPDDYGYTGKGYKDTLKGVSFDVLQRMGDIFIVRSIVNTRVEQIQNFLKFETDEQKEGFTIRKKKSLFEQSRKELSAKEKLSAERIVNFLEDGGLYDKWDGTDNFHDFIKQIVRDSLVLDQLAFETVRNKKGELVKYKAIDASLIRLLDSLDPRYKSQFDGLKVKGHLPRFCMAWNSQILKHPTTGQPILYYPWELGYGVRNKTTNVRKNGYGVSEMETLMDLVTYILWGVQYNGNFFKQGSQPKGFINVKNGNVDNTTLNEFRTAWRQTMSGVQHSHKIPLIQGMDLEWIDLQSSNRDMEFTQWLEFLIIMFCSVYTIDPSELGFNFKQQAQVFGQDGQQARLDHSKNKGLKPLLRFLEGIVNKYIVEELDENLEFTFTGIDTEDEAAQVDLDGKKMTAGMVSFESMFEKYEGEKYDEKKHTILNQVFQQAQQTKQFGGTESNQAVDEMTGEGDEGVSNPFAEFEKSGHSDPIIAESLKYIQNAFSK